MKNKKNKERRPAGVSLVTAIWTIFFGILVIYNTSPFPEPFSVSRAVAVGIAALGLIIVISFNRGKGSAWTTFLVLGIAGGVITLWAIFLGWIHHNPIPIGVSASLLSALFSTLFLISRGARMYCAPASTGEINPTVDISESPRPTGMDKDGGLTARGYRRKKLLALIPVFLLIGVALGYLYRELTGPSLEDEALLSTLIHPGDGDTVRTMDPPAVSKTGKADLKRGIGYYQMRAWQQAIPFLWRATLADPGNADAFFYLGESVGCLKGIAEEEHYLRKAIGLSPLKWQYHGLYGSSSYFVREDGRAWREYQVLRELNRARGAEYKIWLQETRRREPIIVQVRFYIKQAAYFYRKFLISAPTNPDLLDAAYRLGIKTISDEDMRRYLQAIKEDPRDSEANFMLGYLYYRRGELEKSISSFLKAEKLGFKNRVVHYWLGLAYLEKGDPWQALIRYDYLRKWKNPLARYLFERLYPV